MIRFGACLVLLVSTVLAEDITFRRFVVFGDSLSDDGIDTRTDIHGFGRISNGPVWSEYLAKRIGLECGHTENYAYQGAKSGFGNHHAFGNWSGVLWQVDKYFCIYDSVPPGTLVAVQTGGLFDVARGENVAPLVARNFRKALDILAEKGADFILVLNLLDPAKVPGYATRADGYKISGSAVEANRLMETELADFRYQNSGITVKALDLPGNWWHFEKKFGKTTEVFPRWDEPYWSIEEKVYMADYMWYTSYHPSTAVHKKISDKAFDLINNL